MTLTCFTTTGEMPPAEDVAGLAMVGTITVVLPVSRLIWRFGGPAVDVAVAAADTARRMLIAVTAVDVGIIRTVGRPLLAADGEPDTAI